MIERFTYKDVYRECEWSKDMVNSAQRGEWGRRMRAGKPVSQLAVNDLDSLVTVWRVRRMTNRLNGRSELL
jgi:hypothetical protein